MQCKINERVYVSVVTVKKIITCKRNKNKSTKAENV